MALNEAKIRNVEKFLELASEASKGALSQIRKGRLGDAQVALSAMMEYGDKAWSRLERLIEELRRER